MVIHVSLYTLKADDKCANIEAMLDALNRVAEQEKSIRTCIAGKASFMPDLPEGVGPVFCDVAQILTFDTMEDALAYPSSVAHLELAARTDHLVERVFAIDFSANGVP